MGFFDSLNFANIAKTGLDYMQSAKSENRQYKYMEDMRINSKSYERQNYEKAGYNPLMAVTNGSLNMPTPSPASQPAGLEYATSALDQQERKAAIRAANVNADKIVEETNNAKTQGEILKMQKEGLEADNISKRLQAEQDDLKTKNLSAKLAQEMKNLVAAYKMQLTQTLLHKRQATRQQIENAMLRVDQLVKTDPKVVAARQKAAQNYAEAEKSESGHKKNLAPWLSPFKQTLDYLTPQIFNFISK